MTFTVLKSVFLIQYQGDQHSVHLFTFMHLANISNLSAVFIVYSAICYIMDMHVILPVFSACHLPIILIFIGDTINAH